MRSSPQLEDIPELIHRIQLLLPVKEATRTSILSKSWLHASSTIPALRFREAIRFLSKNQKRKHLKFVDHTLRRYLHDNIPIETIDLEIDIKNQKSASLAENLIPLVATRSCLKELSLLIVAPRASFSLPDEILSGKNLTKIRISGRFSWTHSLLMIRHSVINCVFLRELHLKCVHISEEVVDDILSTCRSLVKIELLHCKGFKTIKVKNLPCLHKLRIDYNPNVVLETYNVPNLGFFRYDVECTMFRGNSLLFNNYSLSLGSVTQLWLGGMIMDDAFVDMIKTKCPFLETLTLHMRLCILESFGFTCASMKRLSLLSCPHKLINVQVNAPKLLYFCFIGSTMPSLLFPANVMFPLDKIKITLSLCYPVDDSFFLNMREALMLSRKCYIDLKIVNYDVIMPPLSIDIDDLRRRVPFPAMNVQQMSFQTVSDEGYWEGSPFFDAFFLICHPKQVVAKSDEWYKHNNHFCKLIVREVMEKKTGNVNWPNCLKDVEIRRRSDGKWETLTNSWRSFLEGSARVKRSCAEFKLNWR